MNFQAGFSGYSSDNISECKTFYQDILGLEIKDDMGGFGYSVEGQQVFVYPKENHQPATFTVFNFVVDDIDAAVNRLVEKGVIFERYDDMPGDQDERGIMRGKEVNLGPNIAWFKDPSQNILSVVEE